MTSRSKGARKTTPPASRARGGVNASLPGYGRVVSYPNTQVPTADRRPLPQPLGSPTSHTPVASIPLKTRSKVPLYLGGLALYSLAVYGAYVYISTFNSIPSKPVHAKSLSEQEDISHVYNTIAKKYDKEIWTSEVFMGMPLLRRSMAKRAKGEVLEASVGTGRNIKWYPLSRNKVKSLTFVDSSTPMLEIARKAFHKKFPDFENIHFTIQDAAAPLYAPSGGKFDTIIQSMGLCSHHSPIQLLRNLGDVCKDDGTIILLEHGKSHYEWLNRILDRYADKHAETWGCWWNRDVEEILNKSGLRVVKLKRYHFGTTYWIEAKPPLRGESTI